MGRCQEGGELWPPLSYNTSLGSPCPPWLQGLCAVHSPQISVMGTQPSSGSSTWLAGHPLLAAIFPPLCIHGFGHVTGRALPLLTLGSVTCFGQQDAMTRWEQEAWRALV